MTIKFANTAEQITINKIVDRFIAIAWQHGEAVPIDRTSLQMDLSAWHAGEHPLRLDALLAADDFNLVHDVAGIARHIDRRTGRCGERMFSPRYSVRTAA